MSEVELNEPLAGGYSVTLPMFEGPLDLLLHLCQKHELDILDIPIGFVTEKYLEYLAVMQLMSLDVASEYLVMAATLAHIKSKMLLPAPPPGQEDEIAGEEEDPREALIRRLLEYQKYKKAGEDLQSRGVAGRDIFTRGSPIEEAVHTGLPPLAQVPLFSLVEAFQNVLTKSKVKLSHDIVHERVTLADRINELVDVLRVRRRIAFEDLFTDINTRFDLVITFLALLEMTRLRMTRLFQADFESGIFIEFSAQVTGDDDPYATPTDDAAAHAASAETATIEAAPTETAPTNDAPIEAAPTETAPTETAPTETPIETAPTDDTTPPAPDSADSPDDGATDPPPAVDPELVTGAFDTEAPAALGPEDAQPQLDHAQAPDEMTSPPAVEGGDDLVTGTFDTEPPGAAYAMDPPAIHDVTTDEQTTTPVHTIPCPPPSDDAAVDTSEAPEPAEPSAPEGDAEKDPT